MSLNIEILEDNVVVIRKEGEENPVFVTPSWPNGQRFESPEEAIQWAEMFVDSVENPEAPFAPVGPGEDRLPKLTEDILRELDAKRLEALKAQDPELSAEELEALHVTKPE